MIQRRRSHISVLSVCVCFPLSHSLQVLVLFSVVHSFWIEYIDCGTFRHNSRPDSAPRRLLSRTLLLSARSTSVPLCSATKALVSLSRRPSAAADALHFGFVDVLPLSLFWLRAESA